jgi:hypothetical protein
MVYVLFMSGLRAKDGCLNIEIIFHLIFLVLDCRYVMYQSELCMFGEKFLTSGMT